MSINFLNLAVTRYYEPRLNEMIAWQSQLTGGLIYDVLSARNLVQQGLDEVSESLNLSDKDKEAIERSITKINQLDLLLKQQTPRIIDSNYLDSLRQHEKNIKGWWWHLDREVPD